MPEIPQEAAGPARLARRSRTAAGAARVRARGGPVCLLEAIRNHVGIRSIVEEGSVAIAAVAGDDQFQALIDNDVAEVTMRKIIVGLTPTPSHTFTL